MARGMLFPAGLMVLILVHEACSAQDSHHHSCPPSSCGNIQISYPFRLKDDPPNCGDQRYNLSCEDNQTVLYLYARKYNVLGIGYSEYTIRVVEPGILNHYNISSIPRYFLNKYNFSSGDPFTLSYPDSIYALCSGTTDQYQPAGTLLNWYNKGVVWVKCEKPIISELYLGTSSCLSNGVNSSNSSLFHSKSYRYVFYSDSRLSLDDLGDSCQIEQMFPTARQVEYYPITCSDVYQQVADGFKLSWAQVLCDNFTGDDICYLNNVNFFVQCDWRSLRLDSSDKSIFEKVTGALYSILTAVPRIIYVKFLGLSGGNESFYSQLLHVKP